MSDNATLVKRLNAIDQLWAKFTVDAMRREAAARIAELEAENRREQAETMAMGQSILTYDRQLQDSQVRVSSCLRRIAELEVFESLSRTLDASNTRMAEQLRELEAEREHAVYAYVSTRIAELEAAVLAEREACVMLVLSDQFDDIDSLAAAIRARPAP